MCRRSEAPIRTLQYVYFSHCLHDNLLRTYLIIIRASSHDNLYSQNMISTKTVICEQIEF